jgi:hypothetical protein
MPTDGACGCMTPPCCGWVWWLLVTCREEPQQPAVEQRLPGTPAHAGLREVMVAMGRGPFPLLDLAPLVVSVIVVKERVARLLLLLLLVVISISVKAALGGPGTCVGAGVAQQRHQGPHLLLYAMHADAPRSLRMYVRTYTDAYGRCVRGARSLGGPTKGWVTRCCHATPPIPPTHLRDLEAVAQACRQLDGRHAPTAAHARRVR